MKSTTAWVVLAAAGLAAGCSKPSSDSAAPPASAAAVTPPPASAAPPPAPAIQVDPEVARLLKAVVAGCTVNVDDGSTSDCKNNEMDALSSYAKDKKPEGFFASLAELAMTDGASDPKTFGAAVAAIKSTGYAGGYDWMKANAKLAASRFLDLEEKVKDSQAFSFGSMGAAIPLLGGKKKELLAMLDKRKPGSELRSGIVTSMVDWGGVDVLPDLDAFMKKTTEGSEKYAATWSVGVAMWVDPLGGTGGSPPPSDADKAKMCDWAKGYLTDPDAQAVHGAMASLGRCKGAYIDAALDAFDAAWKPGTFNDAMEDELKTQCWSEGFIGFPSNGTAQQCDRDLTILDKISKDATLSANDRGNVVFTTWVVGQVSPAPQKVKAKAIITRFLADKDKNVSKQAGDRLKDIK
jgi:hypothetical protein